MTKRKDSDAQAAEPEGMPGGDVPQEPQGSGDAGGEDLAVQIQAAEEEAKLHYDKLLRVMAEFDNFKKRMQKERDEIARFGNEKLLAELLPALDDLDRVLEHVPIDASEETRNMADGIALARKSLAATLSKFGLKEVEAIGQPFDPSHHEAIAVVESSASEPGSVIAVHRIGYWLYDRLLRPALVTVAKEREDEPKPSEPSGSENDVDG